MSQLVYSPLSAFNGLHRLGRVFDDHYTNDAVSTNSAKHNWIPAADIREHQDSFNVLLDIPGVASKDVDVTVDKGTLTIKGSKTTESNDEAKGFKRLERSTGSFLRSFTLPETADGDHITAKVENGVLAVSIPKLEKSKPLSISVEG
ncbi:MAG: Hsp20/alpha crystallin family protein [bacterium]|nr:Hsp20/alpha crystallin family protein [Gammaproteobacteria bacterium]HIL98066.1 Hsp20/alpha crystallin family protein [Pseudomonadales bacterium]